MSPINRGRRRHIMLNSAAHPAPPLVVFKIGGSLLDLPDLSDVIRRVVEQRTGNAALLVVGGGAVADLVRSWDETHGLGEAAAHDLALEAMDLSASLISSLFPEARLVRSPQQVEMAAVEGALSILCAGCFIKAAEAHGHAPLEHSWRVTSDSIAAWTARVLAASELVLVKSVPAPLGQTIVEAAEAGLVDENFSAIAENLPFIGWVDARSTQLMVEGWHARQSEAAARSRNG